jgi:hypothetical protein
MIPAIAYIIVPTNNANKIFPIQGSSCPPIQLLNVVDIKSDATFAETNADDKLSADKLERINPNPFFILLLDIWGI